MEEIYPLIEEMLDMHGEVTFTVSGWSMQPMIYNRRDTVTLVKPILPLKKYDLPLFLMDDGKFILHRVIKIHPDGTYECRGDNRWESEDNIRDDQIIGVVKSFNRNGKQIDVDKSFGYWMYTRTWKFFHYFKWMYNYPRLTKQKLINNAKHRKLMEKYHKTINLSLSGVKKLQIEYRAARASDLKDFYEVYKSFVKDEKERFNSPTINEDWITTENAKQYYNRMRQEQFFYLALLKGEIVGFCTGSIKKQEPSGLQLATLVNIYVNENYRSMGIGAEFVNAFKAYCKENNCNNIAVTFIEKNERAEKFYARHGFTTHKRTYHCNFE